VGWRAIFGDEIIERAGPAWGLDAEGEVIGQYRPTGQPGVRTCYSFSLRLACSHQRVFSCGMSRAGSNPDAGDRRTWCVLSATRPPATTDPRRRRSAIDRPEGERRKSVEPIRWMQNIHHQSTPSPDRSQVRVEHVCIQMYVTEEMYNIIVMANRQRKRSESIVHEIKSRKALAQRWESKSAAAPRVRLE
jgi:hypothetical protein